jgi:hypothetical protein
MVEIVGRFCENIVRIGIGSSRVCRGDREEREDLGKEKTKNGRGVKLGTNGQGGSGESS